MSCYVIKSIYCKSRCVKAFEINAQKKSLEHNDAWVRHDYTCLPNPLFYFKKAIYHMPVDLCKRPTLSLICFVCFNQISVFFPFRYMAWTGAFIQRVIPSADLRDIWVTNRQPSNRDRDAECAANDTGAVTQRVLYTLTLTKNFLCDRI
jgi:hypothetical protein